MRRLALVTFAFLLLTLPLACLPGGGNAGPSEEVVRHNIRGTAFLGQQKWGEAESEFRAASALDPGDPLLLNNIAVAKIQQGDADSAETILDQALELDPNHPHVHYNLGLIQKNRGDFDKAVQHFEAVALHDPLDLLTHYNLGVVYSRTDRNDDARKAFEAALERNPAHVSTLYGLGRLLLQTGDQGEGERLVTLSQEIRARSGLDQAVGSQYGEQGPYAMGIDYPGDALAAPVPIAVSFKQIPSTIGEGAAGLSESAGAPPAWAVLREGAGSTTLVYAAGVRVRMLTTQGHADASEDGPGAIVALGAGNLDQEDAVEIMALVAGPDGLTPALLTGSIDAGFDWVDGRFTWDTAAGALPGQDVKEAPAPGVVDIVLVDRDHDGDLDAVWCVNTGSSPGCAVATGDALGNFQVQPSPVHGFDLDTAEPGPIEVTFSDFDNDRDIDLAVAGPSGLQVFSNQRDDTYDDVSDENGLEALGGVAGVAVTDLNKDGFMDLALALENGLQFVRNQAGRFDSSEALAEGTDLSQVVVTDFDNDGFLDLVAAQAGTQPRILRNHGQGTFVETTGLFGDPIDETGEWIPVTAYDADQDGDLDLAGYLPDLGWALFSNEGGNAHTWLTIDSVGVGDNQQGIGAKVDVLSGALRQKFEITDSRPLHAGLGTRKHVESVRYLWPSGVLQDELDQNAGHTVTLTQLDRKGTSCPLLYARDADGWRFVTDFLGGAAVGSQHRRGVYGQPDTDEYVKIPGGIVSDPDGLLRVRLNNQLEEVLWFDQAQLLVIDHPAGTEIFPNEALMPGPPWPEHRIFAGADIRTAVSARGVEDGRDLGPALAENDEIFAENFRSLPYKGYAETHTLELDLGRFPANQRAVLLLDGWIDYADSSSNLAAEQAGVDLEPPVLSVVDRRGRWVEASQRVGFPAGLPKTMTVDLSGLFDQSGDRRQVRIRTNMRIYWDRVRVLLGGEETPLRVQRLDATSAELRFGGFPRRVHSGRRLPLAYNPTDVAQHAGWKAHTGAYTAFGNVKPLLANIDDWMVTTRNGDEIELAFAAPAPPETGWQRSYVFFADGFGKDMDPNSAANEEVGPIPFHGMPEYPYAADVIPPMRPIVSDPPVGKGQRIVLPSAEGWPGAPRRIAATGEPQRGS